MEAEHRPLWVLRLHKTDGTRTRILPFAEGALYPLSYSTYGVKNTLTISLAGCATQSG
jgi:hypothetical protein